MTIQRIILGTWFPRTEIHLEEIYQFFKNGQAEGLEKKELRMYWRSLHIEEVEFQDNSDFERVKFVSHGVTTSITEDGIILFSVETENSLNDLKRIEDFYVEKFGPALAYLFSKGAPLPQSLAQVREIYPKIVVGKNITKEETENFFKENGDVYLTSTSSQDITIFYGRTSELINIEGVKPDEKTLEQLFEYVVFARTFSQLLKRYLSLHRTTWSDISSIYESEGMRYRDFPLVRSRILEILKTISFIRARMEQMGHILEARNIIIQDPLRDTLSRLGFNRMETLRSTLDYSKSLWQMTKDYSESTLTLFESVVEENTQREIRLLQQVAVAGMMVGFFGMNIAFPWNDEWSSQFPNSFAVVGIIGASLFIFHWIIKLSILNRRFVVRGK